MLIRRGPLMHSIQQLFLLFIGSGLMTEIRHRLNWEYKYYLLDLYACKAELKCKYYES